MSKFNTKPATTNPLSSCTKKEEVLAKLAVVECTVEQATAWLSARESSSRQNNLDCKVSEKGGVSVYGLQRMPVTLYVEQWERLIGFVDTLKKFLVDHDSELNHKVKDAA